MDKSIDGKGPGLDQLHDEMANALMRFIQANQGLMGASKKHDEGMDAKADVETWGEAMGNATALAEDVLRKYAAVASGELAPPPKAPAEAKEDDHHTTCPYYSREAAKGNGFADCNCRGSESHYKLLYESLVKSIAGTKEEDKGAGRECWGLWDKELVRFILVKNEPPENHKPPKGAEWVRMVEPPVVGEDKGGEALRDAVGKLLRDIIGSWRGRGSYLPDWEAMENTGERALILADADKIIAALSSLPSTPQGPASPIEERRGDEA